MGKILDNLNEKFLSSGNLISESIKNIDLNSVTGGSGEESQEVMEIWVAYDEETGDPYISKFDRNGVNVMRNFKANVHIVDGEYQDDALVGGYSLSTDRRGARYIIPLFEDGAIEIFLDSEFIAVRAEYINGRILFVSEDSFSITADEVKRIHLTPVLMVNDEIVFRAEWWNGEQNNLDIKGSYSVFKGLSPDSWLITSSRDKTIEADGTVLRVLGALES